MTKSCRFEDETGASSSLGVRHLQCLLIFFGLAVAFMLRVNLSLAIVAMTDVNSTNAAQTISETYEWSEKIKSWVLSSFFCGYFVTQIPAGQLAHKYGGKLLTLQGVLISAIITVLMPLAARLGNWEMICALRILMGFVQSALMPAVHTIIAKWAPVEERGTLATFCYTGPLFGTVIMLGMSGILASSSYGWPSIFYVSGGLGIIWSFTWYIWGASAPRDYKSITAAELLLIESSLGQAVEHHLTIPWSKIWTSAPFYVLMATQCANDWGFVTLLTQIPAYMKHVLGMDINSNALLSALPYSATLILGFVFSFMAKALQKRKCFSLTINRKLFNTIAQWLPMIALIGLGYVRADQANLAVILLILTVGFNAAAFVGWIVNHIDLSPNFAGILIGLTNFFSSIAGFAAPLMVGFVITDEKDPAQWRVVFFVAAVVYFFGNLLFIIFGSAKVQPWNDVEPVQAQDLVYMKVNQMEPKTRNTVSIGNAES